ncbi:MAG: efflux RND transporter periplasmic adaptor subunit [Myxococcota bacterium]
MRTPVLLSFTFLALIPAAGCSTDLASAAAATEEPIQSVELTVVHEAEVPRTLAVTGTLLARADSDVAANAAGQVLETYVERGSRVEKGAPLLRLDARAAELTAEEAKAQAAATRAQRAQASADCARAEKLFSEGAINRVDYERLHTQCTTSEASSSAAAAREELAGKAVHDAIIRAPFAGMIVERFADVGEYVMPASRVVTLVALDQLRLEMTIPESSIGEVKEGQTVRFQVAAFPAERFEGLVRYVGPALRRQTRDLVVEAIVKPDPRLRPGMFAEARIEVGQVELPAVPKTALKKEGSTTRAFVVRNGHAEERLVQPGAELADQIAVKAGLESGDRIVAVLSPNVKDGIRVE